MQWIVGDFTNGNNLTSVERTAKRAADISAISDDADIVVVTYLFCFRAAYHQIVKGMIHDLCDKVAFPSRRITLEWIRHGSRLVNQEDDAGRIRACDLGGIHFELDRKGWAEVFTTVAIRYRGSLNTGGGGGNGLRGNGMP